MFINRNTFMDDLVFKEEAIYTNLLAKHKFSNY